jgi:transposase
MSKLLAVGLVWLGIDVSKYSFFVAIADESATTRGWVLLPAAKFDLSPQGMKEFLAWLRDRGITKPRIAGACIEATGRYSTQWVALTKNRLGPVSTVNPARPRAFGKSMGIRDKSDRVDACVIALYGKMHEPKPTHECSAVERQLRDLSRVRHTLNSECQGHQQRLNEGPSPAVRGVLKRMITMLQREIRQVEQAMQKLIDNDERLSKDLKRAMTVKGIGTTTATVLLAEFGDLRRYNRDEVVALAGLYPRDFTSGVSVHKKSRLAKAGKAPVRATLYMCAMSAIQADAHLKRFAARLKTNHKEPMQVLAAVMRKLLMTVRAVIVTETDYDPNYHTGVQSQAT